MQPDREDSTPLALLGYDSFFQEQLAALGPELFPARIVGQHRREWDVRDARGVRRATLAGKRWSPRKGARSDEVQPTIGDWVAVSEKPGHHPVIEHVLQRRTWLARTTAARRGQRQIVVANVDIIAVVAAFAPPGAPDAVALRSLHPRRLERYLTAIQPGGAEGIVVINKADLHPDTHGIVSDLAARLTGTKILSVSAHQSDGLSPLLRCLSSGKTIGFVGLSGVGKSSIVNALLGGEVQQVRDARSTDARGRHTTTRRSLFVTSQGFLLIDTPGMRELAISETEDVDLSAFTDIIDLAEGCRFRDCSHVSEPGCAVILAANSGKIAADRLTSYRSLASELSAAQPAEASVRASPRMQQGKNRSTKHLRDDDWME